MSVISASVEREIDVKDITPTMSSLPYTAVAWKSTKSNEKEARAIETRKEERFERVERRSMNMERT